MTFTKFIQRPVLSTVISVFLVLLGLIGIVSLPIAQYPDIAPPTISVKANYQGADAQTVLNSVVVPLEESINGVENMTYMESSATNDGTAMITVYLSKALMRHGRRERAKPRATGTSTAACRGNAGGCNHVETSNE